MGKSPGKWMKTLLFGKKASKSRSVSKSGAAGKGPASTEKSPIISEPVLVNAHANGSNSVLEVGNTSGSHVSVTSQGAEKQGAFGHGAETDPEKVREERAATKAQAAFRGFLARRAFHALKGIIRLQALVRGHLVRRQAVVTLHSMLGIIKLQAVARGQKVAKGVDSKSNKLYTNTFVCKLLSYSVVIMPLQIQYNQEDPNSVFCWMDRWTLSRFWKPPSQPKKNSSLKAQTKIATYAMETESARTKRIFKKNSSGNVESSVSNNSFELEKTKRSMKKLSSSTDTVTEHPLSELEKVKRNLRKVTSMAETSEKSKKESEIQLTSEKSKKESEMQSRVIEKIADMTYEALPQSIQNTNVSEENAPKEIAPISEIKPEMEIVAEAVPAESTVDRLAEDNSPTESYPLQSIKKDENISIVIEESNLKKEQTFGENQKMSKRRSSFSAKSEFAENGVQTTPKLPSYMQATQSAKAKLRGQDAPKFGDDTAEKNGMTRRHSLPSSTNGKVISHSPRTQRILQAAGKAGNKVDRSLLSSRDGNDKMVQVEWRR